MAKMQKAEMTGTHHMEAEKNQDSVRAVDRALDILLAFRPGDEALTVAELLKRVDLSRPTLYRCSTRSSTTASGVVRRTHAVPAGSRSRD